MRFENFIFLSISNQKMAGFISAAHKPGSGWGDKAAALANYKKSLSCMKPKLPPLNTNLPKRKFGNSSLRSKNQTCAQCP